MISRKDYAFSQSVIAAVFVLLCSWAWHESHEGAAVADLLSAAVFGLLWLYFFQRDGEEHHEQD